MKYDIVALLTEVLSEAGMSDILDKDLNNHSTISLHMKDDIPTIHIKNDDDVIWIWAQLGSYSPSALSYASVNLFPLLFNRYDGMFYAGQPYIYDDDGVLDLRAQVKEEYLSSAPVFMTLLDKFLDILQQYRNALV
jgi:type III secretion system chaperone